MKWIAHYLNWLWWPSRRHLVVQSVLFHVLEQHSHRLALVGGHVELREPGGDLQNLRMKGIKRHGYAATGSIVRQAFRTCSGSQRRGHTRRSSPGCR